MYIDLGGVIPGVTVEYSPGTRTWPKDLPCRGLAEKLGINIHDMIEEKIISPAEAERRGANKDAVNAIAVRPPRKGLKFN